MSIVIDETTPVLVQGITGRLCSFHTKDMIDYGTNIVGGVTPGRGGETVHDRPVFDTMAQAVEATGATASIVFVPPPFAADAMMEAADSGIRSCVCITEGIPVQDMMTVKRYMTRYKRESRMQLVGPNCAGVISPGKALLGIMPTNIFVPGRVGIIGRSGTLGYEAASQMKAVDIGVSTSVGIGGDPINGSSFRDHLEAFENDDDTDLVVIIGEIGGPQEVLGAEYAAEHMTKPVVGYIAGLTAPPGRTMGHAGAIVTSRGESAAEKTEAMRECGVTIVERPSEFGEVVASVLAAAVPA